MGSNSPEAGAILRQCDRAQLLSHRPIASLITSHGEAVWWACVTVTTVGYGDTYPVTFGGRCIAVAMMVCGIALLGTITAIIASWLVEQVRAEEEAHEGATRAQVELLSAQIERLERKLGGGPEPADDRPVALGRSANGGVRGTGPAGP